MSQTMYIHMPKVHIRLGICSLVSIEQSRWNVDALFLYSACRVLDRKVVVITLIICRCLLKMKGCRVQNVVETI